MQLITKAQKNLTTQNYQSPPLITGVKLVEIRSFNSDDGAFNEIVRLEKGRVVTPPDLRGFLIKQINYSQVMPGVIKAWHLHFKQDEIWFIHPEGKLLVGLLDLRKDSKTKEITMRLVLGQGKTHLLFIPRGVAHGISNPYPDQVRMTYLVNNQFDGTDEKRLSYDFTVGESFWQIRHG